MIYLELLTADLHTLRHRKGFQRATGRQSGNTWNLIYSNCSVWDCVQHATWFIPEASWLSVLKIDWERNNAFFFRLISKCGVHRAAGFLCSALLFRHFLTVSLINTFSRRDVVIRHKLEMLDYSERLFGSEQKQLIYVSPFGGFVSWKKVFKAWKWDWLFFYRRPIKCL